MFIVHIGAYCHLKFRKKVDLVGLPTSYIIKCFALAKLKLLYKMQK